ncbi:hypothetical protein O181_011637 [Austropuccinia psidii MF-1]|uniref:Uncharacterized protein n=1 Tax=Austropuccinia psidii MF-1 TaxID=1389203 RepID=A0A9Q3BUW4_9BASI|nr:hypothetical protein [Austropuccinia psidii MF-1]
MITSLSSCVRSYDIAYVSGGSEDMLSMEWKSPKDDWIVSEDDRGSGVCLVSKTAKPLHENTSLIHLFLHHNNANNLSPSPNLCLTNTSPSSPPSTCT